jgi:hypothetical protein
MARRLEPEPAATRADVPDWVLSFVAKSWLQPAPSVPSHVGDSVEDQAVYRMIRARRAWRDAVAAWAAENGWTTRELYELREQRSRREMKEHR